MADPYYDSMMRRLGIVNSMGASALQGVQSAMANRNSSPVGAGGNYSGPMGGGSPSNGNFIDFGRLLQSRGFRVSENPYFGGVTQGAHVANSDHYRGRAFDVNFGAGTSAREQRAIDGILGLIRQHGFRYIWRQPGHFNHIHIYY